MKKASGSLPGRFCIKESVMQFLSQWANRLSVWGEWIGVTGIMVMVVVTCADVVGAKLFTLPVPGCTEIVSLVQVATMVFAVAATQRHGGHISVEMFVDTLPARIRSWIKAFTSLLGLVLFVLLIVEGVGLGNEYLEAGEVTATVQVPFYPFAYAFSVAIIPIAIMMLVDLMGSIKEALS
jgi:TRAP-type C4-dicarboxylate transport system permease small subunit